MEVLTVLNPVAELQIVDQPRAPRLATLDDAQLGLWWNEKSGGNIALDTLAQEIKRDFTVSTLMFQSMYPAPVPHIDAAADWSDVLIGSTGDCGACTSWLIHDLIELEKRGRPTVALIAKQFLHDALEGARVFGMPDLAIVEIPHILTSCSEAEIRQVAIAAKEAVVKALLRSNEAPATAPAIDHSVLPQPTPAEFRYEGKDQFDALRQFQEDFLDRGFGDGFPLIPPTRQAVEMMMASTSLKPDEVITKLPPAMGLATVEKIAIAAVMAGCSPEHLPVLLATVDAFSSPEAMPREVSMSTGAHGVLMVLNGPIVDRIGVNYGVGSLGPGKQSHVNTVLGRAMRLAMMNIGYCYLGIFDLDTIGTAKKYGMCIAENETKSFWDPLHVERGFDRNESTVTVFSVESAVEVQDLYNSDPEKLLLTFAGTVPMSGAVAVQFAYMAVNHNSRLDCLMLLAPDHARVIGEAGWSKERIRNFIYQNSYREWRWVGNCADPATIRTDKKWVLEKGPDDLVPSMDVPECLHMVVVGGAGSKSQYLTGISMPVTRAIDDYV